MFENMKLMGVLKDFITPENIAGAKDKLDDLGIDGKFDISQIGDIVEKLSSLIPADKLEDFKKAISGLIK